MAKKENPSEKEIPPEKENPSDAAPALPVLQLVVKGPDQGFWRAGLKFGREPQDISVSPEVAAVLVAEPQLEVKMSTETETELKAWLKEWVQNQQNEMDDGT